MSSVLILRPEPGASETAAKATALGLNPVIAPIFAVLPVDWEAPDAGRFDAVLMTSANAARHGGVGLAKLLSLPCYAVGEASAGAARAAGFSEVRAGTSDGAAMLSAIAADGASHILHLCGRDHIALAHPGLSVERRIVYAADGLDALPGAAEGAIADGTLVLLHSPRAAALFARLSGERGAISVAAISVAAAEAAGEGWRSKAVAGAPRDKALLELASKLCQTGGRAQDGQARRDRIDGDGI